MKISLSLLLFLTSSAWAQLSLLPDPMREIPQFPASQIQKSQDQTSLLELFTVHKTTLPLYVPLYTKNQVSNLALRLDSQFKKTLAPLSGVTPKCESEELENYLLALQTSGQFDECAQLADSCRGKTQGPKAFLIAALCESTRYNYPKADSFFELATDPNWRNSPDYKESLFQRASYSLYGHHENLVEGLLALMPETNPQERKMWKALLQRVGEIDPSPISKNQIDQFLEKQIQSSSGSFKGLLLSLQIRVALRDYRYQDAIEGLLNKTPEIQNPLFWYYIGYSALYYGLDQNFAWSREIYDVYNRYAHPWLSFPLENNTYNYTEIYGSICANQLIQKPQGHNFEQIKSGLRTGQLTLETALQKLDALKPQFRGKADYLTTYAGLLALQGQHHEAFELYWEAHKLCPYYNRANWGMTLEKRFAQYSHRPDYDELSARVDRELANRVIPSSISNYLINWNSLNSDVQKRVAYGSRIWLPYMPILAQHRMHTYIKYAYDLLSESPALSGLRDVRIGGSGYPNDNRLWDDVRGVGGSMVVADLAEVYQSVQGDYNLLGHEMAHQFQFLMEDVHPSGLDCIIRQYDQAKADRNFPDSYSSQNKEEHFAQGVTYYLVPADSPSRFGLNQSWVKRNNPAQFDFIHSIDQARGDFSQVQCLNNHVD